MEAVVTIKLTPHEFDLVREAIAFAQSNAVSVGKDASTEAAHRRAANENAAELQLLRTKLR